MTPILYNAISLESNGKVELVLIKVAEQQKSLVVVPLERLLEHYNLFLKEGNYVQLPPVIIPRVDHELIHRLIVNPHMNRDFLGRFLDKAKTHNAFVYSCDHLHVKHWNRK